MTALIGFLARHGDQVNGVFELLGGLFVLNHCRAVLRDKRVAGVSIVSTVFFAAWGVWNMPFYWFLHLHWSFAGGLVIAAGNTIWIALLLRYREGETT